MKHFRKEPLVLAGVLAAALGLLTACTQEKTTDYSNSTLMVQVEQVEDGQITGVIGQWTEDQHPENAGQAGETPKEAPRQKPDGDQTGEAPKGQQEEEQPPENADQAPAEQSGETSKEAQPQKPTGDQTGGALKGQRPPQGSFTASDEKLTFSVGEETIIEQERGPKDASGALEDISQGDVLAVTFGEKNTVNTIIIKSSQNGGEPQRFGGDDTVVNGTAAKTLAADSSIQGETYTSEQADENALRIDGAAVVLNDVVIEKLAGASSNTENGDFYGQNAALLALNGAAVAINGATVTTAVQNGNGVFSYGAGTTVTISDSVIRTKGDNSGGIQTTGGGTTTASRLDIETQGSSSAAIRSDRGGGTVQVQGGTYITNGTGSPAIYSTAAISAANAVLTANASEAIVVEGKNSVTLNNCQVSGKMSGTYGDEAENIHAVMIYQSMSGDAEVGHASFAMTGGSLTALAGDLFYVTNTSCDIALTSVQLQLAKENLLIVAGNDGSRGWGKAGANGGQVTMTAADQTLSGSIIVDEVSTLALTLEQGSQYTGAINTGGAAGTVAITLKDSAQWQLTADSYITDFTGDTAQIITNGYHVYVDGILLI